LRLFAANPFLRSALSANDTLTDDEERDEGEQHETTA